MSSISVIFTIISCESFKLASLTVTVAVYSSLISKSGAETKVITPVDESICNSVPEILKLSVSSSGSLASAVPTDV